ncbi:MAG: FIST C-terminal domain-containing protein [Actinomycetota bacterium]|nr:FIST C-terminal domain-containing protein [Actinomycetota bacterium]
MPFAAALSQHPVTAQAVGEVAGEVLEKLGAQPDLALLFVTPPHAGALEDAGAAVAAALEPRTLLGCAAVSVVGTGKEVEESPGVSLWAGRFGPVAPVRLEAEILGPTVDIVGWPDLSFEPQALVLVADPFSFPVETFYDNLEGRYGRLPVIGGNASAARGPGGNRLLLDGRNFTSGAVGAFLGPGVEVQTVVSQGCRPIGQPYVVTKAEGNVVHELGGEPALGRLLRMANGGMPEEDVALINRGLHVGQVIDEHKLEFGRGDFLVRNVVGADQEAGAIAVNDVIDVGTTVQFHVRDATTADEDLRHLMGARVADGALLFTCNGRGVHLFGTPDHDAAVMDDSVGAPTAGFFAAGEFGPIGGRNFVHGFTASVALLKDRSDDQASPPDVGE